ncbi:MAG: metalloprotease TldD, partial [Gammaproteobacteria bacterium]|nr:metalloprotease TldD [Gammaproteobacteria bacterium]
MAENNKPGALAIARERILDPSGIDDQQLETVLGSIMGHAVDSADLYFQISRHESWSLEDSIVRDAAHSIEQGVGVRA